MSVCRALVALCVACASLTAYASAPREPLTAAVAAMSALLASPAAVPAGTAAFQSVRKRYECVVPLGMRAEPVARDAHSATVLVDLAASATLPVTHAACDFPFNWLVTLRERGGKWQVTRVWTPESDVAARIAAVSDRSLRLSILAEEPRYVTAELAHCLADHASALQGKGRALDAAPLAELALTAAAETGSRRETGRALYQLGRTFDYRDQYRTSMALYRDVRVLAEQTHDMALLANALLGIATEHDRVGEPPEADATEAYRLAVLVGDERVAGASQFLLGVRDEYAGRLGDAIKRYSEAARRGRRAGERLLEGAATAQTGVVYDLMNEHELAYELIRRGIEVFRQAGNTVGVIRNLRNLADMEAADQRYEDAERDLRRTEALLAKHPIALTSAYVAVTHASIAAARKELAAAERYNAAGIDLAKRAGNERPITFAISQLAGVRLEQKRFPEALSLATEAIRRSSAATPIYDVYWHSQVIRGKALAALGRTEEARSSFEAAIAAIERSRPNVPASDEDQQWFLADKDKPYYENFRTFIGRDPAEGLLWVERARTRVLLEFLSHGHQRSTKSLTEEERREEELVEKALVEANVALRDAHARATPDAAQVERLEQKVADARNRRALLVRELYERHPELAVARGDIPLPPVDAIRAALGPEDVALEYVTLPDGAWVIAVTRQAAPRVYPIAANDARLKRLSDRLAKAVAAREARATERSRALYDLLLRPVAGAIRGRKTICIVPDATLRNVPFQMLAGSDGAPLIRKHAVFYAPSLAFLVWHAEHRGAGAARQILAFANPAVSAVTVTKARWRSRREALGALPEAEREVGALPSIYGSANTTLRVGAAATEEAFKREAGQYRILHLATHGMYDDADPMYSHLVLAQKAGDPDDGLLEAREIVDLDLHADLVVLSACETGRGMFRGGEGMVGLSWAFLGAGCPATVVSMWSVESAATARLMIAFHRRLAAGDSPPEALRRAELALMTDRRYHHPYYWAPFVVIGAPGPRAPTEGGRP